jgi:hypothetical protein
MYVCSLSVAVFVSTSSTCLGVNDFDRRPARPVGTSVSSTTFRLTRSRAIARLTARLRQLRGRRPTSDFP